MTGLKASSAKDAGCWPRGEGEVPSLGFGLPFGDFGDLFPFFPLPPLPRPFGDLAPP